MKVKIPKAKPGVNRYWRELKPEEPIFCVGRNGARVWVDLEADGPPPFHGDLTGDDDVDALVAAGVPLDEAFERVKPWRDGGER